MEDGKGKVVPSWIANLGEQPMHIAVHQNKYSGFNDIIVSCETMLFILTE